MTEVADALGISRQHLSTMRNQTPPVAQRTATAARRRAGHRHPRARRRSATGGYRRVHALLPRQARQTRVQAISTASFTLSEPLSRIRAVEGGEAERSAGIIDGQLVRGTDADAPHSSNAGRRGFAAAAHIPSSLMRGSKP